MRIRAASMFLLLMWVGPVTFAQTDAGQVWHYVPAPDPASADARVIPPGQALLLEPGTPLTLRLRGGAVVKGRYLGRTLLDSAMYVPRFAAHLRSSHDVPLMLGETLHVALRDGRQITAAFDGYAELTLLLLGPDGSLLRVPFEFAESIRRANGDRVDPRALIRSFQKGRLPSAEALVLGERLPTEDPAFDWDNALRVPVEDIESATAEFAARDGAHGGSVAGAIVLGVLASVVLFFVLLGLMVSSTQTHSSCGYSGPPPTFLGVRLTTRPFDRSRACYLNDALAAADPWPTSAPVAVSQPLGAFESAP